MACIGPDFYPALEVITPTKNLNKFKVTKFSDFLLQLYKQAWSWSDDVHISNRESHNGNLSLVENHKVVPFTSYVNTTFKDESCTKLDIIYRESVYETTPTYIVATIKFFNNARPYYSSRIIMSSNRAKLYCAATFINKSNGELRVRVSALPLQLRVVSCSGINFSYDENA